MVISKTKIKKIVACLKKNTRKLIENYYYILDTKVHTTFTIWVIWVMLIWSWMAFDDNFKMDSSHFKASILWTEKRDITAIKSDNNYIIIDGKKYKISLSEVK